MMLAAMTLLELGDDSRHLHLYDTYEGMSKPTDIDKSHNGVSAQSQMDGDPAMTDVGCLATLDDVKKNLQVTGYPAGQINFIQGKVEDTIPTHMPQQIALLRLDTDWYESTRHELEHLYPLLSPGGILIIDDYGHWEGARKAVDEYFLKHPELTYLHRIDYTGRLLMKPFN